MLRRHRSAVHRRRVVAVDCARFVKDCRVVRGIVTFNVGISQEGALGEQTLDQLSRLATAALEE